MSLKETIEKAVSIVGSQRELARQMGVSEQAISDYKRGTKPCGVKKRALLADIANENITRALLEAVEEQLQDTIPHEAEAKKSIAAILAAFPRS